MGQLHENQLLERIDRIDDSLRDIANSLQAIREHGLKVTKLI